jgi:NADPH:quinone reductase-like Zn-dependent oxidoreductase
MVQEPSTLLNGSKKPSWIKYPFVMGSDLAGEVVEVGKGVTRFKVGDRVIGHAVGMDPKSNKSSEGAFQEYTIIRANMASPIPSSMPYENACVHLSLRAVPERLPFVAVPDYIA